MFQKLCGVADIFEQHGYKCKYINFNENDHGGYFITDDIKPHNFDKAAVYIEQAESKTDDIKKKKLV